MSKAFIDSTNSLGLIIKETLFRKANFEGVRHLNRLLYSRNTKATFQIFFNAVRIYDRLNGNFFREHNCSNIMRTYFKIWFIFDTLNIQILGIRILGLLGY